MFDGLRESMSGAGQSVASFYRANRGLVLGGITVISILLIVWARLGFTFETSRFFAAECGNDTCEAGERRSESDAYCPEDCDGGTSTTPTCVVGGTTCNGNKIFKHCTNKAGEDGEDCAASGKVCQNNNGSPTVDGARCVGGDGEPAPAPTNPTPIPGQGGYGSCSGRIQHTTAVCALGCSSSPLQRPAGAANALGCSGGATCCVNKPTAMSAAVWASNYDTDGSFFVSPADYDPNCNSRSQQFPYKTARPKKGGGSFTFPEWCVEKPDNCPEGYFAEGSNPTVCASGTSGGGATPVPTGGGGTGAIPSPAVLSVVCGATSNVLTWVTPLPAGSNASAINRTVRTPPDPTSTSTQIGIDLAANPSSWTDSNIVAGNTYAYSFKNHVSVASSIVRCPQDATTSTAPSTAPSDPNALAPGELKAVCTGGTTPSIMVRWSKSPPAGSTGALNEGNPAVLNRTVPPAAAAQLGPPAGVVDKSTYWEWVDAAVPSGSTATYTGKYGANVKTNTLSLSATSANCGTAAVLACAPLTQNVAVNQAANLQSSGVPANAQPQWLVDGQVKSGATATFVFGEQGTKTVVLQAGGASATCTVVVGTQSSEALGFVFNGRNFSTSGAVGVTVNALPNQEVEFVATLRNNTQGNLSNVSVQAGMPSTITYVQGSTSVNGAATSANSITAGGLSIGAMGAGQESVVRWRGRLSATGFPVGQSQAVVNASAAADGQSARSGQVTILVNRTTGAATAQTGPGEAVLAALLVSAVVTLLYVSYTHGPAYRRKEVQSLGKERDPLDFRT